MAGFPYQKLRRTSRVDFMMPNDEFFQHNPTASVIVSAKRTLRERWREVVEELYEMRCPNIFLATADEKISQEKVKRICRDYRIHLVVWDHIKAENFPREPLVIDYSELASQRLPLIESYWK